MSTRLARARGAAATERLDVKLEILLAVIERDLLARRDGAQRHEHDLAAAQHGLRVRLAAMIEIASQVAPRGAVDGPLPVDLEHVFGAKAPLAPLRLRGRDPLAAIGDDIVSLRERPCREQAEPGRRAAGAPAAGRNARELADSAAR